MNLSTSFVRCNPRFKMVLCHSCERRLELAPPDVELTVVDASSVNKVIYQSAFPCSYYLKQGEDYSTLPPQKLEELEQLSKEEPKVIPS